MPSRVLGKVKLSRCISFKWVCVFFYIAVIVVISLYLVQFCSKEFTVRDGHKCMVDLQRNRNIGHRATGQSVLPLVHVFVWHSGKRRFYGLKENVHRCL